MEPDIAWGLFMSDRIYSATGRCAFLFGLQRHCPDFWRSLNRVWLSRDYQGALNWLASHAIVDEWFVRAVDQTLSHWDADPVGPAARLDPDYVWYCYLNPVQAPDFTPRLTAPYPRYRPVADSLEDGVRVLMATPLSEFRKLQAEIDQEPLAEFEKRMTREFHEQLSRYLKAIRAVWDYNSSPQLIYHAQWTALAFTGTPIAEIALRLPTAFRRCRDHESMVRKAVSRFAYRIGLTLPSRGIQTGDSEAGKLTDRADRAKNVGEKVRAHKTPRRGRASLP